MRNVWLIGLLGILTAAFGIAHVAAGPGHKFVPPDYRWEITACEDSYTFLLYNALDGILEWTLTTDQPWLSIDPASGTNPAGIENADTVTIFVDRTGLPDGDYTAEVLLTSNGGTKLVTFPVTVHDTPDLRVNATVQLTLDHPTASFAFENHGGEPLNWSAGGTEPWIDIVPPAGGSIPCASSGSMTVSLNPAMLPSEDEQHAGGVQINSNGGNAVVPVLYIPPDSPGIIGLFANPAGTDCNIPYNGPALVSVYVVHVKTSGATASQFSAPMPACWTNAIYLSDTGLWPVQIGNSQTGVAIGYGTCLVSPGYILAINYFVQSPPNTYCCDYPVLPDPNAPSGQIEIVDCGGTVQFGAGGVAIVNPDASCPCGDPPVAVEETTWGHVKAMWATD